MTRRLTLFAVLTTVMVLAAGSGTATAGTPTDTTPPDGCTPGHFCATICTFEAGDGAAGKCVVWECSRTGCTKHPTPIPAAALPADCDLPGHTCRNVIWGDGSCVYKADGFGATCNAPWVSYTHCWQVSDDIGVCQSPLIAPQTIEVTGKHHPRGRNRWCRGGHDHRHWHGPHRHHGWPG